MTLPGLWTSHGGSSGDVETVMRLRFEHGSIAQIQFPGHRLVGVIATVSMFESSRVAAPFSTDGTKLMVHTKTDRWRVQEVVMMRCEIRRGRVLTTLTQHC